MLRGHGWNSGKRKVWLNAYIKPPLLLRERDQSLRPSLNAKLHLLKLNLAHIMACFLAPSKSTALSLFFPPPLSDAVTPFLIHAQSPLFLFFL